MNRKLSGLTLLVAGGSRGVGFAVVTAAAAAGADVALLLAAEDQVGRDEEALEDLLVAVEGAGRQLMVVPADLRTEREVERAVGRVVARFGGVDLLVNNVGVSWLGRTLDTSAAAFELMLDHHVRGQFHLGQAALPHLLQSGRGHVLTISPPLDLREECLAHSVPYTVSRYASTLLTLGWAAEFIETNLSANCLWPHGRLAEERTWLLTPRRMKVYQPALLADAAIEVLSRGPGEVTGRTLLDAEVLSAGGITDLSGYEIPPPTRHLTGLGVD